jgi:precorrin-6B methylase 2
MPGHFIQMVLDVGCGPGTDTINLAQLLGPGGRIAGFASTVMWGWRQPACLV